MKEQICILLVVFLLGVEAGYCGDWIPLNWTTIPKAASTDQITVRYLAAPLLYCDYEDDFELLAAYHGALALVNTRTGQSWNLNFDAYPSFVNAIIPQMVRDANGTVVDLSWSNFGGVFIYEGINTTYWHSLNQVVATMTGDQFNQLIAWLPVSNLTTPYYNPLSVYYSFPDTVLLDGFECFEWTFTCLAQIQKLGGKLNDGLTELQQSLGTLYSDTTPTKVNYATDPKVRKHVIEFYETIEAKYNDLGLLKFIEELVEILFDGYFYVYKDTDYYLVELALPYFEIHWYPMKIPIVKEGDTVYYHNGKYRKLY